MVFILIHIFSRKQLRSSKSREEGKNRRKNNNEIKNELPESLIDDEIFENEELNLRSNNVRNYNDSVPVAKEFDNIIKCKKK